MIFCNGDGILRFTFNQPRFKMNSWSPVEGFFSIATHTLLR